MTSSQRFARPLPGICLRLLAVMLVLAGTSTAAVAQVPAAQRAALISIYNSTNGSAWNDSSNWLDAPGNECNWSGVSCDGANNVVGLALSDNNLVGTLPDLSALTALESFQANSNTPNSNQLSGSIPDLSALTQLTDFEINGNQFTGAIPDLSALTFLQDFEVSGNQLSGSIPDLSALTQLGFFSVAQNQLSGPFPSLGTLTSLNFFSASDNQLSGSIPALSGLGALSVFRADNNQLSGALPSLAGLASLSEFSVVNNTLTGSIPSPSGLASLATFDVASNQLTGSIPALSGLPSLNFFSASHNQLTGSIPSLSALTGMQIFSVDSNQLTGPIPALSAMSLAFQFNFSSNLLTGPIPSLSALSNLQLFYAHDNQLSGSIPSLSNNGALHEFGVAANQLTGAIPSLTGLSVLNVFDVGTNSLSGSIPSLTGLTALQAFFTNTNQLSGPIPSLSGLVALQNFDVDNNQLSGSIPPLSGLAALQFFVVSNNLLTGSLPSLSGLTALQSFNVDSNQLSGTIPTLSGLSQLAFFTAGSNLLTGSIPSLSGLTALHILSVPGNQLSGTIPALSGLTQLQTLALQGNQLSGAIPSFSGLTALQTVDFAGNQLTGSIPSLTGLTALQFIDFEVNHLTGPLPSLSGLLALDTFNTHSNQLTGSIPSLSGLTSLRIFGVDTNQLTGSIPSLSGLTGLQLFDVAVNQLTGPVPSLSGLSSLNIFYIADNQLSGPMALPPNPSALLPGLTNLCSNQLQLTGNPAADQAWDVANGTSPANGNPGWINCQGNHPTRLAVTSINGGSNPTAGVGFNVVVQSQDGFGIAKTVTANTNLVLSLAAGTGTLGGTLSCQINAGSNSCTVVGVTYSKAESGVTITATVTSGDALSAGTSAAFTVNGASVAPTITSASSAAFTIGTAGTFTVTATGSPTPTLSESGPLPSGVSFNAATGVLSGTPGVGTAGTYPITFTAANGVLPNATQNFTLTVNAANVAPTITSASSAAFIVGTAGNFTVTATGTPIPTLSESGPLPSGVTFNAATGVLGGTPAAGTAGTYPITFTAANGVLPNATQSFTLTVNSANTAPTITSASSKTLTVGTAGTFTVTATGIPAPTLSESGPLPSGVTFNAATGVLSGTPAAGTAGTYPITFTAANGVLPNATQSFTLTVNAANVAPTITSASSTAFTVGTAGNFTVTATGTPIPTLSESGPLPSGVTFNAATGVLSGTPAAGTAGTYPITFTAANGVLPNATQSFTLTVNPANVAPTITSASGKTFTVGTAGSFTVTATGIPAPTLSESGPLPSGITFIAATGVLSGTPAAGTAGTYPITFTAANGVLPNATQNFTLTISAANVAPTITSASTTAFTTGTAGTFTVTATGTPTPTLSESGPLPSGVTFNAASGVLSGTPAAGTAGTYPITFTAANGVLPNATQSFTLTVNAGNVAPTITSASSRTFTVGTAGSFTVTATGTPTPTLSESGPLPNGITFNAATGVLSGTPAAGTAGTYPVTFTAANGILPNATQNFTLTIGSANVAPSITSASSTTFTIGVAGSFTVTATGSPTPTLSAAFMPNWLTFNAATGVLSGTPPVGASASYSFLVQANNGVSPGAFQIFRLAINPATAAPTITSLSSQNFTVGAASVFRITAAGAPTPTLTETGTLPAGVTFNAANSLLSGTPAPGTAGNYPITFTATNGVVPDAVQTFLLTVLPGAGPNVAPTITSASSKTFAVGTLASFMVTATGTPIPTLSESGPLPNGVTFNAGSGVLSGTPGPGTAGIYPVTFTAVNGVFPNATQSFTLTVTPANTAPTITSASSTALTIGTPGAFSVTATGTPTPTLSESGPLPSGVTFNAATGALSGTPAAGTAGTYPITFTAANGILPNATQSFTLTVNTATVAPTITSASGTSFTIGTAGSFTVTATGTPTPTLSEAGSLPSGVTFNAGTGALSGAPAAGTAGSYPIVFTAANGVLPNATQSFTLTVNAANVAPTITSAPSKTFTIGTAGTFTVTATGVPTPTLSETGSLPSGITFNAGTGVLAGTPAAGTAGTYPITFTAANGVLPNANQSFTLTVNAANVAPTITSASSTAFTIGTAGSFTVTATGTPTPTLSATGSLPSGVTFNVATGVLSGIPAAGTAGSYPVSFSAANGVPPNANQSFTLTVNPANVAPAITSASSTSFTVGTAGTFTVTATGVPTPTLSESGSLPSGITFNAATGVLSGTPGIGSAGSYLVAFTASNGVPPAATQSFTLTVLAATVAPTITSPSSATFPVNAFGSFTVTATGTPAPTLSESGALPSGVTFNAATSVLSGTPALGTAGSYPITFTAANGTLPNATQAFVLTISAPSVTYTFIKQFGSPGYGNGQFSFISGVAIDPTSHHIIVLDNNRVQIFDSAGVYLSQFGPLAGGGQSGQWPAGIAIDPVSHNIIVSSQGSSNIKIFTQTGSLVTSFGTGGSGNGQFFLAMGIAIDPATRNILVSDLNNRVQIFSSSGAYLGQFASVPWPVGLAIAPPGNNVLVGDQFFGTVQMFDPAGNFVRNFAVAGAGNGQFGDPAGIAIDPTTENVIVADYVHYRVQILDAGGDYLGQFGSFGTGNGQFSGTFGGPSALAIDPTTHVVVVNDIGGNRLQLFGPTAPPAVRAVPDNVAFGGAIVGVASSAVPVTLTNVGATPFTITGISITGPGAADFVQTNTCPVILNASASCTINVTFTASTGGSRLASVQIMDSAAGSPHTIPLTGVGLPSVSLAPVSLTFGSLGLGGGSSVMPVTLTHFGTTPLTIGGISIVGANPGDFSQTNNCVPSVNAGASCTINVTFAPVSGLGPMSASVQITDNATGSPQSVPLSGTSISPFVRFGTSAQASLDGQGHIVVSLAIVNQGNVTVNSVTVNRNNTFLNSTQQPIASVTLSAMLAPGASETLQILFAGSSLSCSGYTLNVSGSYIAGGLSGPWTATIGFGGGGCG